MATMRETHIDGPTMSSNALHINNLIHNNDITMGDKSDREDDSEISTFGSSFGSDLPSDNASMETESNAVVSTLLSLNKVHHLPPPNFSNMAVDLKGFPEHLEVLKETRTYVFFGPSKRDETQKYFKAIYSRERNFRIEEGYKVMLEGSTPESPSIWNVILIGQAANRHLWVWLHRPETGDVLMRPLAEVADVVGRASADEYREGVQKIKEKEGLFNSTKKEKPKRTDGSEKESAYAKFMQNTKKTKWSDASPYPQYSENSSNSFLHLANQTSPSSQSPRGSPTPDGSFILPPLAHLSNTGNSNMAVPSPNQPANLNNKSGQNNAPFNFFNYSSPQPPFMPNLFPYVYMQAPPGGTAPTSAGGDSAIDQNWRKYVRAQLLRMIHELDALDTQDSNSANSTASKDTKPTNV